MSDRTTPKEGSTQAPTRHVIDWQSPDFYDMDKIETELERVFDICHGCRRCFNLCDSFPQLFDLIDESETGELDSVARSDYKPIIDACTLCDMCFMTKCPYVPPHDFDLDFPHLILRHRAAEFKKSGVAFTPGQLAKTDRNGKMAKPVAGLANWASKRGNSLTRPALQAISGIDADVELPKFQSKTFTEQSNAAPPTVKAEAPAFGRKAVIYSTCIVDYNAAATGHAARAVLAHNGVETQIDYPVCCGMPHLEHGNIAQVAHQAENVANKMASWIDRGYDVITLTASCGLMMKFEWPLIMPENEAVKRLAGAVRDISEYVVDIAKNEGLAPGLTAMDGGITVHMACHARAQNMGAKSAEMLRYLPDTKVDVVERCSGHGGTFGVMKETRPLAVKVAKPAVSQIERKENEQLCSDCPLACKHLAQVMTDKNGTAPESSHPIEIFARAYGL